MDLNHGFRVFTEVSNKVSGLALTKCDQYLSEEGGSEHRGRFKGKMKKNGKRKNSYKPRKGTWNRSSPRYQSCRNP